MPLIKHFLWARHCSRWFRYIISFSSHNFASDQVLQSLVNRYSERLLKEMLLVKDKVQDSSGLTSKIILFPRCHAVFLFLKFMKYVVPLLEATGIFRRCSLDTEFWNCQDVLRILEREKWSKNLKSWIIQGNLCFVFTVYV